MNDQPLADRAAPRIALVTCAQVPQLDADTRKLLAPLAARGVAAEPVVWDDPTVDWAAFDLAIVRSCWDYVPRRAKFLAWAQRVPQLANPAEVLAWNTHKRYLRDLAAAGVRWCPPSGWRRVRPGRPRRGVSGCSSRPSAWPAWTPAATGSATLASGGWRSSTCGGCRPPVGW